MPATLPTCIVEVLLRCNTDRDAGSPDRCSMVYSVRHNRSFQKYFKFTKGADKSLARPTSRCRKDGIDSVVGKRGLFMCRIASLFLLKMRKESMSGDAHDFNKIET